MAAEREDLWQVGVVEDDENVQRQIKEYLEGEKFPFGKIAVVVMTDFDAALELLRERRLDLLVLDIFEGVPGQGRSAGLELLQRWQSVGFAPVILYTALPQGLKGYCSTFVRLVPKASGDLPKLREEIEAVFATRLPVIYRAILEHLDTSLTDYMWKFVVQNWDEISRLTEKPDFLRLILRRLALQFSTVGIGPVVERAYPGAAGDEPGEQKIHPAEYYIKPPVGRDPQLGDLRVRGRSGSEEILVVVWPSCDLVHRDDKCKVDRALCARAEELTKSHEYKAWREAQTKTARDNLQALMRNQRRSGQAERYHFLPGAWDIPHLVVDFQDLEHVDVGELRGFPCRATLASPFAESLGARFIRYLGRLGTPDLDTELLLAQIGGQMRPEPAAASPPRTRPARRKRT